MLHLKWLLILLLIVAALLLALLIDDIQFIIGKASAQEELLYTIDALLAEGKPVRKFGRAKKVVKKAAVKKAPAKKAAAKKAPAKKAPAKKKAAPSKADMVAAICSALDMDTCEGLEKSTGSALNKLLSSLA